jgi:hypothetical protein
MALMLVDTKTGEVYQIMGAEQERPGTPYIDWYGKSVKKAVDTNKRVYSHPLRKMTATFKRAMVKEFIKHHLIDPALLDPDLKPLQSVRELEL